MRAGVVAAMLAVLLSAPFTLATASDVGAHGPCPAPGPAGDEFMTDACGKVVGHGLLTGVVTLATAIVTVVIVRRHRPPDRNERFALALLALGAGAAIGCLSLIGQEVASGGDGPFWVATVLPMFVVVSVVGRVAEELRPADAEKAQTAPP